MLLPENSSHYFIATLNMAALLRGKPASVGTSYDSCCAKANDKRHAPY